MISVDANLLLPAIETENVHHAAARAFLDSLTSREDVATSEFILLELYGLLRNPVVVSRPLTAAAAAALCQRLRRHPLWTALGFPGESRKLHDRIWGKIAEPMFARRRAYDVRTAFCLIRQGVTDFATINVKDFQGLGFKRVWNPLAAK